MPKLERPQHVTIDIDVSRQICISELDLPILVMARTAFLFFSLTQKLGAP
jgi:hypothetical protein